MVHSPLNTPWAMDYGLWTMDNGRWTMDTLRFISRVSYLYNTMRPDFAHKLFEDQRADFSLLMETLAMGG